MLMIQVQLLLVLLGLICVAENEGNGKVQATVYKNFKPMLVLSDCRRCKRSSVVDRDAYPPAVRGGGKFRVWGSAKAEDEAAA